MLEAILDCCACVCVPGGAMVVEGSARPDWPLISQFRRMAPSVNKVLSTNLFKVLRRFWSQKQEHTMKTSWKEYVGEALYACRGFC